VGLTAVGTDWALAEGEFGGSLGFSTYVLIANPNDVAATVTLTVLREDRGPLSFVYHVQPNSRFTADASTWRLDSGERFGVRIQSDQQIAVERAMYWNGGGEFWGAGTNETGTHLR
jgi:hypothetical protein